MKFGSLDRLFGTRDVSAVGRTDLVDVDLLAPSKPAMNLYRFHWFRKSFISSLFRSQKPLDHWRPYHQPIDVRSIEASLKRGERKISKLEYQISKLESAKYELKAKVSDQTKVISELTKTILDQTEEIANLNKIILTQKDKIEEINIKEDATQNILQWYNQTNDNLCKRLIDKNNEVITLQKFVDNNRV